MNLMSSKERCERSPPKNAGVDPVCVCVAESGVNKQDHTGDSAVDVSYDSYGSNMTRSCVSRD